MADLIYAGSLARPTYRGGRRRGQWRGGDGWTGRGSPVCIYRAASTRTDGARVDQRTLLMGFRLSRLATKLLTGIFLCLFNALAKFAILLGCLGITSSSVRFPCQCKTSAGVWHFLCLLSNTVAAPGLEAAE